MSPEISKLTLALGDSIRHVTDAEERAAADAAVKHLGGQLSPRYGVYGVELRIARSREASSPSRYFTVVIGDYENRRTWEVAVDTTGELVAKTDLTGSQPAIISAEIAEARKIAESQPVIAALAKAPGGFVQAFRHLTENAPEEHLVGLRYGAMTPAGPRALAEVEVDFGPQKVIRFETIEAL